MYKYHCLNPISAVGLDQLDENYVNVETAKGADAILVRSAKMHEMEFDKNLKAIARAGAGVNNIPLCRRRGCCIQYAGSKRKRRKRTCDCGNAFGSKRYYRRNQLGSGIRRGWRYCKDHREKEKSIRRNRT